MNEIQVVHPPADQLARFLAGNLDEVESGGVEAHLADCEACRSVLEGLPQDSLVSLLRGETPLPDGRLSLDPTSGADSATTPFVHSGGGSDAQPAQYDAPGLGAPCPAAGGPDVLQVLAGHPRYLVLGPLGAGGMGSVYKAEHRLMERPVALKVINRALVGRPGMAQRFRREVKAAARLSHPNIAVAHDADQVGDTHFLVMEYVEGQSLADHLRTRGPLPVHEACEYVRQAALGLQHAHEQGMVHRDVKPHNLMVTPDGRVKILDFGLARYVSERAAAGELTDPDSVMGTPEYIAPEQARDAHRADIRADIYSLGCTLYHLLAGRPPFPESTVLGKLAAHLERSPQALTQVRPDVPPALDAVVARMMAKDPAGRYQTPAEVAEALAPFLSAPRPTPAPRRGRPRRPWLAVAVVAALAALAGAGFLFGPAVFRIAVGRDEGELILQVDDPKIDVSVNGKEVVVQDGATGRKYTLKPGPNPLQPGRYQIAVGEQTSGLEFSTQEITITRNGTAALHVTLKQPAEAAAPKAADLDFVPGDAVAFASVRVADLWAHPAGRALLDNQKDLPAPLRAWSAKLGVSLEDVERITLVEESVREPDQEIVGVTTAQPYDRKAVLTVAAPDATEKRAGNGLLYVSAGGPSVYFFDDRTFLLGRAEELQSYLNRSAAGREGPLTPTLRLAAERHVLVAGLDMAAVAAVAAAVPPNGGDVSTPAWLKPLLKARVAGLTVDLDGRLRANLRVTFAREADAKDAESAVEAGLDLARNGFTTGLKDLAREENSARIAALLGDVGAALNAARAEQKGAAVEVSADMPIDAEKVGPALAEGARKVKNAAKQMEIVNDLKQLALASVNYADANNGTMLPAAVYDKSGKPLLSWRVLLLPYVEQGPLYQEFHLDEPWDSEHNKKLLEKMPAIFAPTDSEAFKKHETYFQAFVGKGTVFEKPGLRFPADITDGLSNTLLFVEAKTSVPWTKPEDVPFDEGKLLPRVGGLSKDGFAAAFCDGSVRFLPFTITEETLRALITRNGGEQIDLKK